MNENHKLTFRPLVGGIAIRNSTLTETGTLGLVVTSDGITRWILSCYHVLCRRHGVLPAGAVEDIVQPKSGAPNSIVARITDERVNRQLDCAAARIGNVVSKGLIHGIGRLSPPTSPAKGMRVLKAGAETGVTEGEIKTIPSGDEVLIDPVVDGQVICGPGDSGSIWVNAANMSPVAMTCELRDPGGRAFARDILAVLQALGGLQMIID